MTFRESFEHLISTLNPVYEKGEAESIALLLMEHYAGITLKNLKFKRKEIISPGSWKQIEAAIPQLIDHRPVQYIIGEAWFCNMKFYVDENVLIPRPETEELVNWVRDSCRDEKEGLKVLEIGTGSGCIAIALKKAMPYANVIALDISEGALEVAKKNAESLHADVQFLQADFLQVENHKHLPLIDIIVSNPPYIPIIEKEKLDANVAAWEPSNALFVPGNNPLLFYEKIASFGLTHLQHKAMIFVECHQDYAASTLKMFQSHGYKGELKKDIFENERMVKALLQK